MIKPNKAKTQNIIKILKIFKKYAKIIKNVIFLLDFYKNLIEI